MSVGYALKNLNWVNDMHEELNNFTHKHVWSLVERPSGSAIISWKQKNLYKTSKMKMKML
jgi:hypothetical protein